MLSLNRRSSWPRAVFPLALVLWAALATAAVVQAQTYSYDAAGRLVRLAYPEGGGVAYTYDAADNMTSVMPLMLPPAPAGLEITRISPTEARVSWQADPSATGYVIERRRTDSSVWQEVATVSGNTTTFIDTTLDPEADYVYRIAARNEDGPSAYSAEAGFLTLPAPAILQNGVVNGATFSQGQPIAPGSIVSIFGSNLGVRLTEQGLDVFQEGATTIPLPKSLGGYSVLFNDEEAALFFVGGVEAQALGTAGPRNQSIFAGQINAQVPWEVEAGTVSVVVRRENDGEVLESEPMALQVAAVSPGIFTLDFGPGRAAALNRKLRQDDGVTDFSFALPEGSVPNRISQPAPIGGIIEMFVNGLGPVDPPAESGNNSLDQVRRTTIPLRVFVGGAEAQVVFMGLSPQFVALYQVNVVIPAAVVPGDEVPIQIEQGGVMSRPDVTIAVRNAM